MTGNKPPPSRDRLPNVTRPRDEMRRLYTSMSRLIKADIEALDHELALYERTYGMPSKTFYASYVSQVNGRLWSPDFAAWSALYMARLERESLYRQMLGQPEA